MSTLTLILLTLALIPLLLALRIYFLLPTSSTQPTVRRKGSTCSLGIFLGSGVLSPLPLDHNPNESQGGHTAEMRTLLSTLDITRYSPRTYVYCYGDDISLRTVLELESSNKTSLTSYSLLALPRARRVAQPLPSTLLSSLRTFFLSLHHILLLPLLHDPRKPFVDVLILNGPGTCVVLVLISWIRRVLGLRYTRIIYVESFARVKSLSLSGKLVRRFVDMFLVQWPDAAGVGFAQIIRDTDTGDGQPGKDTAGDGELGEWDRGRGRGKGQVQYRGWLV